MAIDLPLVLEPRDLHKHLQDLSLLIVDLSGPQNFAQGHIPGAVQGPAQGDGTVASTTFEGKVSVELIIAVT